MIIITNVMMRGSFLNQFLSENVKALGFWEELSSLGFKTIGARMTALNPEQTKQLLHKLKLSPREHRIMVCKLYLLTSISWNNSQLTQRIALYCNFTF